MSLRERLHLGALEVYRRLPVELRRRIVRTISPSFTVGAMCFVQRDDGALLLVRHSYRTRWGVPGGLLQKGEDKADAARREAFEETGLEIELVGPAAVQVDAPAQRIDLVFRAVPAGDPAVAAPRSPEIVEVRWFLPSDLPELQFETAGALEILRRRADGDDLPEPTWPNW